MIIDSLDASAEGIGEQDSARPSRAIAPLLDIARRENGPAALVLGNCVKTGAHSRGSGVIEDRADVVFELRDATNFHPSGKKPWLEELPAPDAASWASRSARRKRQEKYRMAFVPTKFRIAEEPEPFILEIDLTTEPWSVRDVTDDVDREGKAERNRRARERAEGVERAREALAKEIRRRHEEGKSPMLKDKDAIPFLMALGLKRNGARDIVNSPDWQWVLHRLPGQKGHPVVLILPNQAGEKDDGGGNTIPPEPANNAGFSDPDFRRPHEQHTAEIPPPHPYENNEAVKATIPADDSIHPPSASPGNAAENESFDFDDEVAL